MQKTMTSTTTYINNNSIHNINNQIRNFSSKLGNNIQSTSFSKTPMGVFADQLFLQPIDPSNTKPITDLKIDTKITLQQKFERAYLFKETWKSVDKEEKKLMIIRFRDLLVERLEKLASDQTQETGKPIVQAKNEIKACVDRINFFLHNFESVTADQVVRTTDQFQEILRHEPLGVIANISAWNYPFFIGLNVIIPALLTGNCVLYKPSEFSSLTGLNIMSLLYEAGVPEQAFQIVLGKSIIAQSLLALPLDGVFFTGSFKTGKSIQETLAGRMVKTQLELGGKCAAYVHKSADLAKAVASLADGAMYNTGQSCCSVERIYVDHEIYDRFVEELKLAVKSFRFSFDPTNPKTYFGPLTRGIPQIEHLQKLIGGALKRGAILELGGNVVDNAPGYFFAPTILSNVHHGMPIQKEEIFGPVVTVQPVKSRDEAAALMNDTPFGLAGSVYSECQETANFIIQKCNSGTVYWNACDRVSPYLPWTGRGHSGIGSTLGIEGITTFTKPKGIHLIGPKLGHFGAKQMSSIIPQQMLTVDQIMQAKGIEQNDYAKSPQNEMDHKSPALPSNVNIHPIDHSFPLEYDMTEENELLTDNDEDTNDLDNSNDVDLSEARSNRMRDILGEDESPQSDPSDTSNSDFTHNENLEDDFDPEDYEDLEEDSKDKK
ncbi:aldehyde dehydrogenase [Tieghemostelium lacteum]|uniref:Aldehyde dehydrogenase n=1 Tax=Tieghemostelium lacteum TaxID=361077 RepID=A0A151ZGI0_TIELA|nr:aldehyde dehydrogenase [Tieghemostelium lacteum]|eukprot:KYQ93035.1 aldehyde dehydrogenase [Tieghemostelium lacteum]